MSSGDTSEHRWNCLNCRRRKVRCDRRRPCSNCVKGHRDCIFPTSGRIFRRAEPRHGSSSSRPRQVDLLDRLRHLESVVEGLNSELETRTTPGDSGVGTSPDEFTSGTRDDDDVGAIIREVRPSLPPREMPPQSGIPHSSRSSHSPCSPRQRLETHNSQVQSTVTVSEAKGGVYVGDRFWATLRREIRLVRETFAELEDDEPDVEASYIPSFLPSNRNTFSSDSTFVLGKRDNKRIAETLARLRPLPSQMLFIWHTFIENVIPFVHVIHIPSTLKALQDCKYRFEALGPTMEPLMFIISAAAVNSLAEEEVQVNFNRDKEEFITDLLYGTEQALARADFTNTSSLTVVQALVLYLHVVRRDESTRHTWSLIGLIMRIMLSMGLHRDGSCFPNMSPFEVEMRRRVWWHIVALDERLGDGQVPGMAISGRNFDTREPANVNDEDLDPAMTEPPRPREGRTDASITLTRVDMWRFMQVIKSYISKISTAGHNSDADIQEKTEALRLCLEKVAARYPEDASSPSDPFYTTLITMCSVHTNLWKLVIKHLHRPFSRSDLPDIESFLLARSVLEDIDTIRHSPATRRFSWILQGHVQWQPYAIILSRIGTVPWDTTSEDAWKLVTQSLDEVSEAVQADTLWKPLHILLNRAYRHRIQQLRLQGLSLQTPYEQQPTTTASHISTRSPSCAEGLDPSPQLRHAQAMRTSPMNEASWVRDGSTGNPGVSAWAPIQMDKLSLQPSPTGLPVAAVPVQDTMRSQPSWLPGNGIGQNFESAGPMELESNSVQNLDWEDWSELLWSGAPIY